MTAKTAPPADHPALENLTGPQAAHIQGIAEATKQALFEKYEAGQAEHGGNLWEKPVGACMDEEIIDLIVYRATQRRQLRNARGALEDFIRRNATSLSNQDMVTLGRIVKFLE